MQCGHGHRPTRPKLDGSVHANSAPRTSSSQSLLLLMTLCISGSSLIKLFLFLGVLTVLALEASASAAQDQPGTLLNPSSSIATTYLLDAASCAVIMVNQLCQHASLEIALFPQCGFLSVFPTSHPTAATLRKSIQPPKLSPIPSPLLLLPFPPCFNAQRAQPTAPSV